ncbi:MAG: CpsD/CapB family tyrosine-protein kinase [Clostridia bacterium]|nr:CpsD/CapB family tyrosine-protein kinase [Clostridia bacterium]
MKKNKIKNKKKSEYVLLDNKSSVMEAYRIIRTNIEFSDASNGNRSILVTSSVPNEGKTTVVCNLARAFAQTGYKTVLVDLDLRKPVIYKIFGISGDVGVTSVITGKTSLNDAIVPAEENNLYILPSGIRPINPSEFLRSSATGNLIRFLKSKFDIVLIDSPPAIAVADASIISTYVDSTLLVASANFTDYRCINDSINNLKNVNANLIGVILNNVNTKGSNYSYKYGYYSYK